MYVLLIYIYIYIFVLNETKSYDMYHFACTDKYFH